MASYKIIQDVEAEDKLVGPLTIKQLLYALLAGGILLGGWYVGKSTSWYAAAPFAVVALPFIFMAAPLGRDQPNDIWLLARMNFWLRSRKRLWIQSGNAYRVTVVKEDEETSAPPPESRSAAEIEDRARHLSSILDSRGRSIRGQERVRSGDKAAEADSEHERQHEQIHTRFHGLLKAHHANRKKVADQEVRRGLRARSHGLDDQSAQGERSQSFKTRAPRHLSAKISEITKAGDLKISTLESLVKTLKSKEKSKKGKR